MKLYGLSLGFCVRDMVEQKISVELFLEQKVFQPRKEGLPVHGISNCMNCFWVEVE